MNISKVLAFDIVNEMKKIINKNINYISNEGKIIASTDEARVGTYHEGGEIVVKTNKMLIIEYDDQYEGAKKGINLPVTFDGNIVGVIGISGEKEEVEKYGQIIKKMTEILIKGAYLKEIEDRSIEDERVMLESLLFVEEQDIAFKKNFNIPFDKNGVILSLSFQKNYNFEKLKKIFVEIKKTIKKHQAYLMINRGIVVILIFRITKKELNSLLEEIQEKIKEKFSVATSVGVGSRKLSIQDLKISYKESILSLEWGLNNNESVVYYSDMKLELILNKIDEKNKRIFLNKIFKDLTPLEIEEYKKIFEAYEKYNGSIKKISEAFFMHKNTLQYKLAKLKEKIGLDMRSYQDFAVLKIAFMLYN